MPVFMVVILLGGCSPLSEKEDHDAGREHDEVLEHEHMHEAQRGDTVVLPDSLLKEFGIRTAVAGPGILKGYAYLPGEVVIPSSALAHVHPRFPGIVKEVFRQTGDRVHAGETLAVIESNVSLTDYPVRSRIDGVVTEMHLVKGEMVDEKDHGFLVADLSRVWVYLKIYQKDLPYVREGQGVLLSAGEGFPVVAERIDYISPLIDAFTRTGQARIVLQNEDYRWMPGLFVSGKVEVRRKRVDVLIPRSAVERLEDMPVVFIRRGDRYFPRMITIGLENDEYVEVLEGVAPGEEYVTEHGFVLKAELQKGLFGEGHAH